LAIEASSGVVLLLAALVALLWANSPWRASYTALWHTPMGLRVGPFSFQRDLHFVINDGLMTVFFFVVGLEIRREASHGELSSLRRASLPLAAALGGMLAPAAIYAALNQGPATQRGWGIPMATDIAFAVGVLALLGKRVPPALRILLLSLAVIDDVGAIIVIAVFYSGGLSAAGLALAFVGLLLVLGVRLSGQRNPWAYVPPSLLAWYGAYAAGIHPTLVGVVVGLMTPARAWLGPEGFVDEAERSVGALREEPHCNGAVVMEHTERVHRAGQEAVSPVDRLQHALHHYVAFGIMPLFALANAGVSLTEADLTGTPRFAFLGVCLGLVVGKPLGVLIASYLAVRLGLSALPRGVTYRTLSVVGAVAGIGFTMSVFVAQLAFPAGTLLGTAKLGVLVGSFVAATLAFVIGRAVLPTSAAKDAAKTAEEAETSTDL
jgi:NhaA family Na+:H+ antiporter